MTAKKVPMTEAAVRRLIMADTDELIMDRIEAREKFRKAKGLPPEDLFSDLAFEVSAAIGEKPEDWPEGEGREKYKDYLKRNES